MEKLPDRIEEFISPRKILEGAIEKFNELLICPIISEEMNDPIILPSGNTVDKKSAVKLKNKKDPFNRTLKVSNE